MYQPYLGTARVPANAEPSTPAGAPVSEPAGPGLPW
jgi:hypothetical protein